MALIVSSVISKKTATATVTAAGEHQPISLAEPSVVKLKAPQSAIKNVARSGDDLVITLAGGEVVTVQGDDLVVSYKYGEAITIENYFVTLNGTGNDLVLEDQDGLWLADLLGSEGDLVAGYTPIDSVDPLLVVQQAPSGAGEFAWWALALGGVVFAASSDSHGGHHSPPPLETSPLLPLPDAPAPKGDATLAVTVANAAGPSDPAALPHPDTTPPAIVPAITHYADDVGMNTGDFGSGTTTDDRQPVLNGTLDADLAPGERIAIYEGATFIGDAALKTGSLRDWSLQLPSLADGSTHTYTAKVVDSAGSEGHPSNDFVISVEPAVIVDSQDTPDTTPVAFTATEASNTAGIVGADGGDLVSGVLNWSDASGQNVVDYQLAGSAPLMIDLSLTGQQDTGFGQATFVNIQGIYGGGGNDTFTDSAGNNLFEGRGGNDTFNLTQGGHDTLLYRVISNSADGGCGHDEVNGFSLGIYEASPNADRINLADLLIGYTPSGANGASAQDINGVATINPGDNIASYLHVTQNGNDTVLSIDRDGAGGQFSMVDLITLHGVQTDLATLLANHQLIVV